MPEFIVAAGSQRWSGWKTIELIRSMEMGPDEFVLTLTSNNARDAQRALNEGTAVTLWLDNELLVTGYIDELAPEYDAETIELVVRGRSAIADLVDCSLPGKQFKNQAFINVARTLCQPFGIEVIVAPDVNAAMPLRQPALDEGQPIWDFLEREARALALRLMSTPKGQLLITNTGTEVADNLVLGQNIRRASATFNQSDRYSEYTILGDQVRAVLNANATNLNLTRGKALDEHIRRYRPITILADDHLTSADCQRRAQWQRNTHYGRGKQVVYTVGGWQQSNGNTWQPNTLSVVDDEVAGINDIRLIVEARLILDDQGPRSELLVMPPEAMRLTKLPPIQNDESVFGGQQ